MFWCCDYGLMFWCYDALVLTARMRVLMSRDRRQLPQSLMFCCCCSPLLQILYYARLQFYWSIVLVPRFLISIQGNWVEKRHFYIHRGKLSRCVIICWDSKPLCLLFISSTVEVDLLLDLRCHYRIFMSRTGSRFVEWRHIEISSLYVCCFIIALSKFSFYATWYLANWDLILNLKYSWQQAQISHRAIKVDRLLKYGTNCVLYVALLTQTHILLSIKRRSSWRSSQKTISFSRRISQPG